MTRSALAAAFLLALGCASAGPPRGPKHVPTGSSESETACPKERSKAQEAREALLGEDLSGSKGASLNSAAAEAVFAHGKCEAAALSAATAPTGNHDALLAALRTLRMQTQDAIILLEEVGRYDTGLFAVEARLAAGSVKLAFAKTVSELRPPADMESEGRAAFQSELEEAASSLRLEVSMIVGEVLEEVSGRDDAGAVRASACGLWQRASDASHLECQ